jgi:hypothetical protein
LLFRDCCDAQSASATGHNPPPSAALVCLLSPGADMVRGRVSNTILQAFDLLAGVNYRPLPLASRIGASVATLVLGLRCSWCPESAPMPGILGLYVALVIGHLARRCIAGRRRTWLTRR